MAGSGLGARIRAADPGTAAALLAGLGALAVIRTTMLPTVGSWDTAEAQVVLPVLGTMHPTGFPAYVILGWLASVILGPLGTPAFLMNLLSALLVALAVSGTVLVTRRLGTPLPLAVGVAAGFALTPVVWSIGNAADAHALHLALVVLLVLALLRWERLVDRRNARPGDPAAAGAADRAIVITAGVFGVAVANHALSLLLVPAIGLYVLAVEPRMLRRPRLVIAALGASLGVAALLYLQLPLRAGPFRAPLVYGRPDTWAGFWDIVLARQFQGDVVGPWADPVGTVRSLVALAQDQFGPLVMLLPAGLLVTAVRYPRYALLSGVATAVTVVFASSYVNARIDRYYLGPVFLSWTWLAVLGSVVVEAFTARAAEADEDGPPHVPAWRAPRTVVSVALAIALLVPTGLALDDRWRGVDRSRDTWVEAWLDEALSAMEPDAVVVSWWSYSTPLWYAQLVEGRRTDVFVVDDRTRLDLDLGELEDVIDAYLGRRPVYLMRLTVGEINDLRDDYVIEPVGRPGNLFRVTGRQEPAP
ncbi:MAG: hypothetical protein A2V85_05445 [Chloroflexi bacterium RBG_16_72_14]|nr:MAG: hypothetical protein A2V85_05445 [Chloroflexi bacterium RBG_16_72_14]